MNLTSKTLLGIAILIAGFYIFMIGVGVGSHTKEKEIVNELTIILDEFQKDAVKLGIAYWYENPTTGKKEFKWDTTLCVYTVEKTDKPTITDDF